MKKLLIILAMLCVFATVEAKKSKCKAKIKMVKKELKKGTFYR